MSNALKAINQEIRTLEEQLEALRRVAAMLGGREAPEPTTLRGYAPKSQDECAPQVRAKPKRKIVRVGVPGIIKSILHHHKDWCEDWMTAREIHEWVLLRDKRASYGGSNSGVRALADEGYFEMRPHPDDLKPDGSRKHARQARLQYRRRDR